MERKCVRCGSNGARGGSTRNDGDRMLQAVRVQEGNGNGNGNGNEKLVVMCFPCAASHYGHR